MTFFTVFARLVSGYSVDYSITVTDNSSPLGMLRPWTKAVFWSLMKVAQRSKGKATEGDKVGLRRVKCSSSAGERVFRLLLMNQWTYGQDL